MRFYQFNVREIVDDANPNLDLNIDPKLGWALRNPHFFPIDINKAPYELILRVPGIGIKSAKLIVVSRRYGKLTSSQLKKIGVVMKRAQYFIVCRELPMNTIHEVRPEYLRQIFTEKKKRKKDWKNNQLSINWNE